jgi:hypothetical protein
MQKICRTRAGSLTRASLSDGVDTVRLRTGNCPTALSRPIVVHSEDRIDRITLLPSALIQATSAGDGLIFQVLSTGLPPAATLFLSASAVVTATRGFHLLPRCLSARPVPSRRYHIRTSSLSHLI